MNADWRLTLGLAWRRHGALPWVAAALVVAAATMHAILLPDLRAQVAGARAAAEAEAARGPLQAAAPRPDAAPAAELDTFIARLARPDDASRQAEALLALAARHRLVLGQVEYRWTRDAEAVLRSYEIALPARGSYAQLRAFVLEALATQPALALEEAVFRRDAIGARELEARLRLVLHVREAAP